MTLIDAEKLEEKIEKDFKHKKITRYDRELLLYYLDIEMLIVANALMDEQNDCENCDIAIEDRQLVVRCNDCRYWIPINRFHQDYHPGRGECELNCWVRDNDWFCADGERK